MEKLWLNPIISDSSFGTNNPRQNSGFNSGTQGYDTYECLWHCLTSHWHGSTLAKHHLKTKAANAIRLCPCLSQPPSPPARPSPSQQDLGSPWGWSPKAILYLKLCSVCVSVCTGRRQLWGCGDGGVCGPTPTTSVLWGLDCHRATARALETSPHPSRETRPVGLGSWEITFSSDNK